MKIMVFNGILLFMLFMWTSAEIERDTESKGDLQDQEYDNESRVDILTRARACKNIDGKCIKKNRDCPNNRPLKKDPGSPYCSKQRHCCYPAAGCVFGEKSYSNKAVNEETCLVMQCNNGDWEYTKQIREDCNTCTAAGDPHILMFDEHCIDGNCGHNYTLSGQGEYAITQDSISLDSAIFGVESHLQQCNDGGGQSNHTCVQNITYYEPGITVTLTSQDLDVETTEYCSLPSVDPITDPRCAIKVFVNGEERIIGNSMHSFYSTDGTVLVFNHPNIVSDLDRNCVNIVGSKSLSVSLCIRSGDVEGTYGDFTWLDVSAMPSLESSPSKLYGLCDTNTGATRNNYTMSGGSVTDDLNTFTESWKGGPGPSCEFGGEIYPTGAMIQGTCMNLKCIEGRIWNYTGNIDQDCGECQLYGDPHIFTYDNHTSQGIDKYYPFMEPGIFIVTQSGLDIPAEYGLSASMELCYMGETCVRGIKYFEPGMEINITLPTFNYTNYCDGDDDPEKCGKSHCYSDSPSDDPECAIKVYVNGAEQTLDGSVESVYGDDGTVLLFPHNHYGNGDVPYDHSWKSEDTICINIVGSKGLSMSLCMSTFLFYSNMYVWASPTLRGQLYGLCDTYTGAVRDGYTMQNGSLTYNDTDLFGSTWKTLENEQSPGTSVDKCTNATVLAEIQELCDDITEDVCEIIPPWQCAGFIAACVYDLCRTFNIDLQAQAYANHLLIHGHLHQ